MKINYIETLKILKFEFYKQNRSINLIASENYSSITSIIYSSSCLTNKYTEGYPFNRYYSGCKMFDLIECKAILLSQQIFNCNYSNIQPHSGSQANFAALQSLICKDEKILSLDLKSGGHLTHGFNKNFSGKYFNVINYYLDKNNLLNYSNIDLIIKIEKPRVLILGYSSYQKKIDWKKLYNTAKKYNCYIMTDISHISGLICSGLINNPINYSDLVTSTTHKTLRGVKGGIILSNDFKLRKKINNSVFPGQQGGCNAASVFGKLISFKEVNNNNFIYYTKQILINTKIMLKVFIYRKYNPIIIDTDNHMFLIKFSNINTIKLEKRLEKSGIFVNKNFLPNDFRSSLNPSGIRLGLSCLTTRYFKNYEIEFISNLICDIIEFKNVFLNNILIRILCKVFPIYK